MLVERLRPTARAAGEDRFLDVFADMDRYEVGADRQRRLYRQTGSWQAVIDDLKDRWARELDVLCPPTEQVDQAGELVLTGSPIAFGAPIRSPGS